jgi:MOSC domain-containing protein YiiM
VQTVLAVLVGTPVPYGPRGLPSAIHKSAVPSAYVGPTGLHGDVQGDPSKHGGPEKAVHHYPSEHYRYWREHGVTSPLLETPGAFGENVTTLGLTEDVVCIGDVYRIGEGGPTLQVTQTRQPCWKLNVRFGVATMAADVQRAGRTGWHYRVLEEGTLHTGATFELVQRPNPDWPLARLIETLYVNPLERPALQALFETTGLAESMKGLVRRRLESSGVESWENRLHGRA